MATFKDYLVELAPPWLRQALGEAWWRAVGDSKDALVQRHKEGVKARLPLFTSPGGLTAIGGERQLQRGSVDTDATYAARLIAAWGAWYWAGTATGLLTALAEAGFTNVAIITATGRAFSLSGGAVVTTLAPQGTIQLDPPGHWARFFIYFYQPLKASWVSGGVPSASSDEVESLRRIIRLWKPAFASRETMVVQLTGRLWDVPFNQTWDDWTASGVTWDSNTATYWTP